MACAFSFFKNTDLSTIFRTNSYDCWATYDSLFPSIFSVLLLMSDLIMNVFENGEHLSKNIGS